MACFSTDDESYCTTCSRQFKDDEAFQSHLDNSSYHGSYRYCVPCRREFVDDLAREQHWANHSAHRDTYSCTRCEQDFSNSAAFEAHKWIRTEKHYICLICDIDFKSLEALQKHWSREHKDHYCEQCNILYQDASSLLLHKRTTPLKHHFCATCQSDFQKREHLVEHWKTHDAHKELYDSRCDIHFVSPAAKKAHQLQYIIKHHLCDPCDIDYPTRTKLVNHWKLSERHKTLYDARCNIHFASPIANWAHKQATPDKHKLCEPCRLDFPTRETLIDHWNTNEVHKQTYDSNCDRLFDSPVAKQIHIKETPTKHNLCEKCQADFESPELLKSHWNSTAAHLFTYCQRCEQDFFDPRELQQVMETVRCYAWLY